MTIYDPTNTGSTPDFDDFSHPVAETSMSTTFETTERYDLLLDESADTSTLNSDWENRVSRRTSNYLTVLDGWFKAPATGTYTFYLTCDDHCKLELDSSNPYSSGRTTDLTSHLLVKHEAYMEPR